MKEIEIGEYVRTKDGIIAKVVESDTIWIGCDRDVYDLEHLAMMEIPVEDIERYIKKHSKNIKELIEPGDYVNGMEIEEIRPLSTIEIKSIVTHEQFEQAEYRVEEGEYR